MDERRFDQIVKSLAEAKPRREVLHRLVGLPLSGVMIVLLGTSGAALRRQRRKERDKQRAGAENHKHEHRRRKHRNKRNHGHKGKDKKTCKPESAAQTCDGKCGQVKNNCKKTVECGACICNPPCPACQVCDEASQRCVPDPAQAAESCGGCRICADGECVIDASIICTPLDQCHEAGECDPAMGECTNPRKPDGTSCDDGDLCTSGDRCQNGECRGTPKDCSAESDVCNDGVCRSSDGDCIKRPKTNGTSCNADNDSCTSGDSCQNGICTPGAGVDCRREDDACNRGVCRQSDGACIKDPRPDGTPCGANGECADGSCEEVVCLALGESCASSDNQCCGDAACAEANCFESGDHCCHGLQGTCGEDCECCGDGICERSTERCCHHTQGSCETTADCCQDFFNRQACIASRCCALPEEPCEAEGDCCEGLCHPEGFCTGCLGLQQPCGDQSQCCQSSGLTHCVAACDFNIPSCCRPPGGSCGERCDCCDQTTCCNGVCCDVGEECVNGICRPICRLHGQNCIDAPDACCPGFECRSADFETVCRPATCLEFAEECWAAGSRSCCTGECTTIVYGDAKSCCSPEGEFCRDMGVYFPGGDCCGANVCNGANRCARCRQQGESCDGIEDPAGNNCCNTLDSTEPPLRCVGGVCVR